MKVRDSGMPEADYWETLFDIPLILDALGVNNSVSNAVEFGCGHGTFAVPAAHRIVGRLYALDLEPDMIEATRRRAEREGVTNLELIQRDFIGQGTGLTDESVDYAMLFNILHAEEPLILLREARRILRPGGHVGVIHWNYDPATPRGPSMDIRPRPEDCRQWVEDAGFVVEQPYINLPPHHYGILGRKEKRSRR